MEAIPEQLAENCGRTPERGAWLAQLPEQVEELMARWGLQAAAPFEHAEATCAWVAPVVRKVDGSAAVLKLGMPHMEGADEIRGLRFWNDGDATVRLLEWDERLNGMLLERCEPGYTLRGEPEERQDVVIAGLL